MPQIEQSAIEQSSNARILTVNAEILSVGTELLLGQIVDTHAPVMARILAECGIGCTRRSTIGDNWDRLVGALQESLSRADVVVTIGGLGPTQDDLTRDAIAAALGDEMEHVAEYEQELRDLFASRGFRWTESIARQADKPKCARFVDNPHGTAPGLICQKAGKVVVALPGPKGEFDPMAKGPVRTFFEGLGGGVIHSRTLRIIGMGESHVEDLVRDLMEGENPTVAPYAHTGEVHLRVTARAQTREEAEALIEPVHQQIRSVLGDHLFGTDETTLEQSVVDLLKSQGSLVGVAESMTGGGLAARLTAVPGSSEVFRGGVVTYQLAAKVSLLGVGEATLKEHGPVSEAVAREMAEGARRVLGVDYALSITGNAGPTSDVDGKPVGLVFVGCAGPDGVEVQEQRFRGVREDIQRRASQTALSMLRTQLAAAAQKG
jgi:nicotinamide-nucleotide amidase